MAPRCHSASSFDDDDDVISNFLMEAALVICGGRDRVKSLGPVYVADVSISVLVKIICCYTA